MPPEISGILETALYAGNLPVTAQFYEDILGLPVMLRNQRMVAFAVGASDVLLIFQHGASVSDTVSPSGTVPGHDGSGRIHMAFAIPTASLAAWRLRLAEFCVPIIGEQRWPLGGVSLYVHDPDDHVIEFATPGNWPIY